MFQKKPVVLMILDGWGYQENTPDNAIAAAATPQWDAWQETQPHCLLDASGIAVGLPAGQMGNSEVGHMHIGAGRIIPQDFTRINQAIQTGAFFTNAVLDTFFENFIPLNKDLHIMGLLSPGGVHSHEDHLFAFLKLCHQKQFNRVYLHLFLDGRDMPPQSALPSLKTLAACLQKYPVGRIASLSGRYFAMDRDRRWDRILTVYQLVVEGKSTLSFDDAETALQYYYAQEIYDEFIPPVRIGAPQPLQPQDAIFFFNFRADRARQLTEALQNPNFTGFFRPDPPQLHAFLSMTAYAKNALTIPLFSPELLSHTLASIVAQHHMSQLRIAETEKYAHVTFFFNGGSEAVFDNEERILIPSPQVATYDLQPEMSAMELTYTLINAIKSGEYDLIICNYANADMVGHTGNFEATVKAIECIDYCMKLTAQALQKTGGDLIITADHGNAEMMYDKETNQPHTAHSSLPVPFMYVGEKVLTTTKSVGSLIDVAPTILYLLDLPQPFEMTGHTLLSPAHA